MQLRADRPTAGGNLLNGDRMSLLNTIASGLKRTEQEIGIRAHNILGASNKDSTVKEIVLTVGEDGVVASQVVRDVSVALLAERERLNSRIGLLSVTSEFYEDFLKQVATPGDSARGAGGVWSSTLDTAVSGFLKSLTAASGAPDNLAYRLDVVGQAENLASVFNDLYQFLEKQKAEIANVSVPGMLSEFNKQLEEIRGIDQIIAEMVPHELRGLEHAELLDKLDAKLLSIAEYLSMDHYVDADGRTIVTLRDGNILIDTTKHQLQYDGNALKLVTINEHDKVIGSTILLTSSDDPTRLAASGAVIGALALLRDISQIQKTLADMASTIGDAVNDINSSGVGAIPHSDLLGDTMLPVNTQLIGSGDLTIVPLDAEGKNAVWQDGTAIPALGLDLSVLNGAQGKNGAFGLSNLLAEINSHNDAIAGDRVSLSGKSAKNPQNNVPFLANIQLSTLGVKDNGLTDFDLTLLPMSFDKIKANLVITAATAVDANSKAPVTVGVKNTSGTPYQISDSHYQRTGSRGLSISLGEDALSNSINVTLTMEVIPNQVGDEVLTGEPLTFNVTYNLTPQAFGPVANGISKRLNPASVTSASSNAVLKPGYGVPMLQASMVDQQGRPVTGNQSGYVRIAAHNGIAIMQQGTVLKGSNGDNPYAQPLFNDVSFNKAFGINRVFATPAPGSGKIMEVSAAVKAKPELWSFSTLVKSYHGAAFAYSVGPKSSSLAEAWLGLDGLSLQFAGGGIMSGARGTMLSYSNRFILTISGKVETLQTELELAEDIYSQPYDPAEVTKRVNRQMEDLLQDQQVYGALTKVLERWWEIWQKLLSVV